MREAISGMVVMLDALGGRAFNTEEALKFIVNRDAMLADLNRHLKNLGGITGSDAQIAIFGDTIILTWPLPEVPPETFFLFIGSWLRRAIKRGLENNVLLRGAVTVGEFIRKDATVLGPAISDAVEWYERASWIGAIATPSCGVKLSLLAEDVTEEGIEDDFVRYPIPLKNGIQSEMWAVSWPADFIWQQRRESIEARTLLLRLLSKYSIPLGSEDKFENTIRFFDWYCNKHITTLREEHPLDNMGD